MSLWHTRFAAARGTLATVVRHGQLRTPKKFSVLLTGVVLCCSNAFAVPMIRVGYVIPQNRAAQAGAVDNLRDVISNIQNWYGEQMNRYGFGDKSFHFETEPDGITPRIHVVTAGVTDDYIRGDTWGRTIAAAQGAGLPIWTAGQVWLLVPESHLQNSDGSISGGTALGASFGSGSDAGVAMMGSDFLFRAGAAMLQNTQPFAGAIVPQIGPYPLVQDVSFPWFEGNTFSSIASSVQGAAAHELGHALGLGHDFRNDNNFDGYLMGNGLRGWRGSRLPELFPADDTQLGQAAATALNVSQYFNASQTVTDTVRPTISIQTSGTVSPVNGLLQVSFTASDSQALAGALLRRNGETIGELALNGTSVSSQFDTSYYTPGQNDTFEVSVYDAQGNRQNANVTINVATGFNRALQPFIDLSTSAATIGQTVQLDASQSQDPGGNSASMLVEWDVNGDGVFDTSPTTNKLYSTSYSAPGDYKVFARLTDTLGASSISTPLVMRVTPLPGDFNFDGNVNAADYVVWRKTDGGVAGYNAWFENFGRTPIAGGGSAEAGSPAVPEPSAVTVMLFGLMTSAGLRCRQPRSHPERGSATEGSTLQAEESSLVSE